MTTQPPLATSAGDQGEIVTFLSSPSSYGLTTSVQRHQTHGAMVFLAGDRAYKLKRAVRYPYMDYGSRERRREMCERELAVNRRTAPDLYLEVRAIVRGEDGKLGFAPKEAAGALDWVVVMRRFDDGALLEQLRQRGELTVPLAVTLAETVAAFHKAAEIDTRHGGFDGISSVIGEDAFIFRSMAGSLLEPARIDRLSRLAWRALDRHGPFLDQRRQDGFVRRCHGDLHLNNICVLDGLPVLFDAIEFNDDFSCIDTMYDLAFLLMDLDRHALRGHANAVLNRYLEITGDFEGLTALPLFLSCRAAVKSHVTVAGAQARKETSGDSFAEASRLLDNAIDYLQPPAPRLIVIGGLSGTGKSTLARNLAPAVGIGPGAVVLRSDVIRKRLLGVAETERLPEEAYSSHVTDRVFERIAKLASQVLAAGYSVVADAVYGKDDQRRRIEAVAAGAEVPFTGLWLTGPQPLLEQRITARTGDASDATVAVLRHQLTNISGPTGWDTLDASGTPDEVKARAAALLQAGRPPLPA